MSSILSYSIFRLKRLSCPQLLTTRNVTRKIASATTSQINGSAVISDEGKINPCSQSSQLQSMSFVKHPTNIRCGFNRNFSTSPNAEESENTNASSTPTPTVTMKYEQKPSVLSNLPPDHTPGQAWHVLQIHLAGHQKVRLDDFITLCDAARDRIQLTQDGLMEKDEDLGMKDAKVIRTALLDLKRLNDFYITVGAAERAVQGMRRSLAGNASDGNNPTPEDMVKAGIFIGEAFANENTGLYISAETSVLNEVLFQTLYDGVKNLKIDDANEGDENGESDFFAAAANVAKSAIDILIRRASTPTKDMKKREKRKYLKYVRCCSGPTAETIDLAVKICLEHEAVSKDGEQVEGLSMAKEILDAYGACPFIGSASEETAALVKDVEGLVAAKKEKEVASAKSEEDDDTTESEQK